MQVYPRNDTVAQRHRYLQKIRDLKEKEYKIFYQEEPYATLITPKNIYGDSQLDGDGLDLLWNTKWLRRLNIPSGNGKRLIINHVGSEDGFLGTALSLLSVKRTASITIR